MNAIDVCDLVKRYHGTPHNAVDHVSFAVPEGQFFCLLGPNGAGKTTTVSILTTTLAPTAGSARIAGRDVALEQAAVRRELGIVFQQPSLDLNLTAEENIRLHAVLYGLYPWRPLRRLMPRAYRTQLQELAEVLGLGDVLDQPARSLSGGMRRKLEIVRALLHRPRVLFLDEPTAGLDPESRRSLWAYVRQIQQQSGATVVLTTHYLEEAEAADALCVLLKGHVVEYGSPSAFKARQLRPQLVLDAVDRTRLRCELAALGVAVTGTAPLRLSLGGRSARDIVCALTIELTRLEIVEPSLEDAYLQLLERAAP